MLARLEAADVAPMDRLVDAVGTQRTALATVLARWKSLTTRDLPVLNRRLHDADVQPIVPPRTDAGPR